MKRFILVIIVLMAVTSSASAASPYEAFWGRKFAEGYYAPGGNYVSLRETLPVEKKVVTVTPPIWGIIGDEGVNHLRYAEPHPDYSHIRYADPPSMPADSHIRYAAPSIGRGHLRYGWGPVGIGF